MKGGRHEYLLIARPARGAMDSPSQHTDTLNYIVQFLHTNGLYAAEDALVRELENRYPELEASSPTDLAPVQPFQPSM